MDNGTLIFKVDGKDMELSIQDDKLKQGDFYASLHMCYTNDSLKFIRPPTIKLQEEPIKLQEKLLTLQEEPLKLQEEPLKQ